MNADEWWIRWSNTWDQIGLNYYRNTCSASEWLCYADYYYE